MRNSKFIVSAAVAISAVLGIGAASAADLAARPAYTKAAPVVVAPVYNWSGFYIGINGGGGWGTSNFNATAVGVVSPNFNVSGGMAGGTAGFNWQTGALVLGVEGDGDWANLSGSGPCLNPAFTCGVKDSWIATIRGRVGLAAGNWLFFGTAGGAFGDVSPNVFPGSPGFGLTSSRSGWTAGAGIEYGMTPNWSIKGEYRHIDLGSATCPVGNCSAVTPYSVPFRADIGLVGINYRFGGPVVAKY
jgi:outer membrane immunogenic protein